MPTIDDERCPFCGGPLDARARATHPGTGKTTLVVKCPHEGEVVLAADLVEVMATIAPERWSAARDYLRTLRTASKATETLSMLKLRLL